MDVHRCHVCGLKYDLESGPHECVASDMQREAADELEKTDRFKEAEDAGLIPE